MLSVKELGSSGVDSSPLDKKALETIIEDSKIESISQLNDQLLNPLLQESKSKSSKHKFFTSVTIVQGRPDLLKSVVGNVWNAERDGYYVFEITIENDVKLILTYNWIYVG